jgi:hypothetical protein
MLEIFALIGSIGGIAALARGRGGTPWIWGTVAFVGYLLTAFCTGFILALLHMGQPFVPMVAAWLWIGGVALFLRFGLGRKHAQPESDWFCANCKTLNKKRAVLCEACKQTWESQRTHNASA